MKYLFAGDDEDNNIEEEDWDDNDLRFGRLSLAAAHMAQGIGDADWRPDVLHLNDWPTALAPGYLRWLGHPQPTLLTIHNHIACIFSHSFLPRW